MKERDPIPSYQSLEEISLPPQQTPSASGVQHTCMELNYSSSRSMVVTSQEDEEGERNYEEQEVDVDAEMGFTSASPSRDDDDPDDEVRDVRVFFKEDDIEGGGKSGNDKKEEDGGDDTFNSSMSGNRSSFSSSEDPLSISEELPSEPPKYQWHLYAPDTKNVGKFLRWAMVGGSKYAPEQTDEQLLESLQGLAKCLQLLRQYLFRFGMPERGGPRDQELLLREVIRDLYAGGAPLWALEPVMQKAAEGLTGQPNVNWQLYPRKAFVYNPSSGTTSMFRMDRGFNIGKMSAMEGVTVRLASFASNVQGVSNIPARFPDPHEFRKIARESVRHLGGKETTESRKKMARKILNLASKQQGLFYFINSREYKSNGRYNVDNENDDSTTPHNHKRTVAANKRSLLKTYGSVAEDFWVVTDEERELFSRLACQEGLKAIDAIDARAKDPERKTLYTPTVIMVSRVLSAAGACAFWFGGSWQDMIVAGVLGIVVAFIGTSSILSKQERLVYEVVASFVVGMTSGLLALTWPDEMCFQAMAISGVLDLLQGFRVVYAVIEIMSKHTVSGGADLLEGILFTGLISYFLQFGSYVAASFLGTATATEFSGCTNGIDERFFFLLVPAAALGWSTLFTPHPRDLPAMAFHGTLGYCVSYSLGRVGSTSELNYFVSASVISLSAGIFSRFTGRQAVANTVAGMYAILPGAYLVRSVYSGSLDSDFFVSILKAAVIIGIGGWTGTILCSPTLLGTTRGLLWQRSGPGNANNRPNLRHGNSYEDGRRPSLSPHHSSTDKAAQLHHRNLSHTSSSQHHRRNSSQASNSVNGTHGHHRVDTNLSYFDFEHPTSTMLFF